MNPQKNDSYKMLGVKPEDVATQPQITPMLKLMGKTISKRGGQATTWMSLLAQSGDPDAAKVLEAYNSVRYVDKRNLPIEAFCHAAGVSTYRVLELITAAVVRTGAQASTIIASVSHPYIVEKSVEMALTDDGFEDRQLLHKAVGFLPTPKGSQTSITVTQNANPQVAVAAASPESTIRRLADRFNQLKEAVPKPLPPAEPDEVDLDVEPAEIEEEEDDSE